MAVLTARRLCAGYRGRPVLREVDVTFAPGLHLVLGENGAGKTTLFRALAGVLAPTAGQVLVNGLDPARDVAAKALIGVGAHRAALAPRLSVEDNLYYWAYVLAVPAAHQRRYVERAMGLLELGPVARQRAGSLSRGQAQRVSLARAVLLEPPVLILDEPLAGVDPAVAIQLRDHVRALADCGHTVVVSTHELAEMNEIGGDVTILRGGRVAGHGDAATLRAELLGERYRLRLRASGDLAGALARLGYRGCASGDGSVIVDVPGPAAVESLVAGLVAAGVGVREVAPASNPLEDLYLHGAPATGGPAAEAGARADGT